MVQYSINNGAISITGLSLDEAHQIKAAMIDYRPLPQGRNFKNALVLGIDQVQDELCRFVKKFSFPINLKIPSFRLSAQDFENGKILSGFQYKITSLSYDDELPSYPYLVMGRICVPKNGKSVSIDAIWNSFGECTIQGERMMLYDIVRSPISKSAKNRLSSIIPRPNITVSVRAIRKFDDNKL